MHSRPDFDPELKKLADALGLNENEFIQFYLEIYNEISQIQNNPGIQNHDDLSAAFNEYNQKLPDTIRQKIAQVKKRSSHQNILGVFGSIRHDKKSSEAPQIVIDHFVALTSKIKQNTLEKFNNTDQTISELLDLIEIYQTKSSTESKSKVLAIVNAKLRFLTTLDTELASQANQFVAETLEQLSSKDENQVIVDIQKEGKPSLKIEKTQDGLFRVSKPAPKITSLVIGGGGAKGVAGLGLIKYLIENNLLDNIQEVAGASAGAMLSAFIALGLDYETLTNLIRDTDITKYINFTPLIRKDDGVNLQVFFKKIITETFKNKLEEVLAEKRHDTYCALKHKLDNGHSFTFLDLTLLKSILPHDEAVKIKDLHIAIADITDIKNTNLIDCCTQNTPNLPIDLALRISPAHPLMIDAFVDTNGLIGDAGKKYADGGIACNVPIQLVGQASLSVTYAPDKEYQASLQKFHVREAAKGLWTKFVGRMIDPIAIKIAGGNYIAMHEINEQAIRNRSNYNIILNTGEITTLKVDATNSQKNVAITGGYDSTETFFQNRKDEAQILHFDNILSLVLSLSDEDRQALRSQTDLDETFADVIKFVDENIATKINSIVTKISTFDDETTNGESINLVSRELNSINEALTNVIGQDNYNFLPSYRAIINEQIDNKTNHAFTAHLKRLKIDVATYEVINNPQRVLRIKTPQNRSDLSTIFTPPSLTPSPATTPKINSDSIPGAPTPASINHDVETDESLLSRLSNQIKACEDKDMRQLLISLHDESQKYLNSSSQKITFDDKTSIKLLVRDAIAYCKSNYTEHSHNLSISCAKLLNDKFDRCAEYAPSYKKIIGGIALGILGLGLVIGSVAAIFLSHGLSLPISIYGVKVGISVLTAAVAWTGLLGMITLPAGVGFFMHGLLNHKPTLAETASKLQDHAKPHLPRLFNV